MRKMNNLSVARIMLIAILMIPGAALFAQVDESELQKNLAPVTFINFEGPHSRIETREQIRNIGVGLGQVIKVGQPRVGASNRYFVIHCVGDADGSKMDADVFGLGIDVGVDHIRNLRRIIQGYLQTAYDYSEQDAILLAEYITIYNAVYRGDWDYYTSRYKDVVVQNLTKEKAGLSIRFDEWPGQTLMVIPLGMGGLSSIDTTTISDARVVEEMRKEDDRSVEQRRDMVDLKEREADQADAKARIEREAIRDDQQKLDQEKQDIASEREQLEKDAEAGIDTRARQEELDRREQAADQQQQALDQRSDNAQKQEDFAEQKNNEAQQDRQSIAQDQQAAINQTQQQQQAGSQQPQQPQDTSVIGARIEKKDSSLGRLLRLNSSNGREMKRSPLDTVNVRTLTFAGDKILAIAGEATGKGAIRLIEINNVTLEMTKQGDDDIHPNSLLWVDGSNLYAITVTDKKLYVGRFGTDLVLQSKATVEAHPNASVTIQNGVVLTQRSDGGSLLLDAITLVEKK